MSRIENNQIQLFIANLTKHENNYDNYFLDLSEQEKIRANQFKVDDKKLQFVLTRAILKQKLADYLDIEPLMVEFEYKEHGKPVLHSNINKNDIFFNVSHSQDYAAIVVAQNIDVGVDIEHMREGVEFDKLAQRFFSKQEYEYIYNLNETKKRRSFFNIWSAKEAFIKAQGEGVSFGLDKFTIPFATLNGIVQIDINKSSPRDWYLESCFEISDYSLSVCANHIDPEIKIAYC